MRKFFVGCNIHFESELEKELREIWPYLIELDGRPHSNPLTITETALGGLVLEAPLHIGLQINFFSKLANRVLLRIKEFKARDFPKVFQTLSALRKDSLLQGLQFGYHVAASESRLNNEKRLQEILIEVFGPENENSNQSIYLRMHQDLCSLSLDTTGTHLHKRSQREKQGAAPLRETLAAFCIRKLIGDLSRVEIQGVQLIDPFCGTGTLLREAQALYQPSFRSDFPFLQWSQTARILKSPSLQANYPKESRPLFASLKALDRDPKMAALAQASLRDRGGNIQVQTEDLFQAKAYSSEGPVWVLSNPPYGERLEVSFSLPELISQIDKIYSPERLGLLVSEKQARQLRQTYDSSLKLRDQIEFQNGGIAVRFLVFTKSRT